MKWEIRHVKLVAGESSRYVQEMPEGWEPFGTLQGGIVLCRRPLECGHDDLRIAVNGEGRPLSVRARNCLERMGVETVSGLKTLNTLRIHKVKDCGAKTVAEIVAMKAWLLPEVKP